MKIKAAVALLFLTCLCVSLVARPVNAYTFNPNDVIDDGVFYNTGTMGITQIDNFLNTFPNSCISTNSGFGAPDPTGYRPSPSQFFYSSSPVSAGMVIYDAAQAYGLNPQVLLTTMQKEEGIVDGSGPYGCGVTAMASALGYGCTDSGTNTHDYNYPSGGLVTPLYYRNSTPFNSVSGSCVNSGPKAGFSEQVIHAAWLLRFGQERSLGNINWNVHLTNYPQPGDSWDNSDDPQSCYSGPMTQGTWQRCPSGGSSYYDGYTTIDNSSQCAGLPTSLSVHMNTGATAALYWYTPHICGNYSFFNTFTSWFGSTQSPDYSWQLLSQYAYTDSTKTTEIGLNNLSPGQTAYIGFSAKNTGNITWYNSGYFPMDVGTANQYDRISTFCSDGLGWLGCNRPARMKEVSVAPGQTATFEFTIKAPQTPGTYREYFNPVAEGRTWLPYIGFNYLIVVN